MQLMPGGPETLSCFLCGETIQNPAEKWTWVGATGQQIQLHSRYVLRGGAALHLDAKELAFCADAEGVLS